MYADGMELGSCGTGARKIETEGIEMKYLLYVPENKWREERLCGS